MKVNDILKRGLVTVDINTSIYDVANVMKKHNIGFLPVTSNNKIMGVITDRDIVINCVANNCENDSKIEDYINKNIISIDISEDVKDALKLMKDNKIKRLIVVNKEKIVGVLSLSDIIESDEDGVLDTIKTIWKIQDKDRNLDAEIDEFYL